jgi:hypothetical protein
MSPGITLLVLEPIALVVINGARSPKNHRGKGKLAQPSELTGHFIGMWRRFETAKYFTNYKK